MKLEQIRNYKRELNQIAQRYGIESLAIFGSVARGESTPNSDIDFLLDMKKDASLFGVGGFIHDASLLLGVSVDAVPRSTLATVQDREFVHRIQEESVLL